MKLPEHIEIFQHFAKVSSQIHLIYYHLKKNSGQLQVYECIRPNAYNYSQINSFDCILVYAYLMSDWI